MDARQWDALLQKELRDATAAGPPPDSPEDASVELLPYHDAGFLEVGSLFSYRIKYIREAIVHLRENKMEKYVRMLLRSIVYYSEDKYFWDFMHNYVQCSTIFMAECPWRTKPHHTYKDVYPWGTQHIRTVLNQAPGIDTKIILRRSIKRQKGERMYIYIGDVNVTQDTDANFTGLKDLIQGKEITPWKNQIISVTSEDRWWSTTADSIHFMIHAPEGTPLISLAPFPYSIHLNIIEREWILPYDSTFRVIDVTFEKKCPVIHMTYTGPKNAFNRRHDSDALYTMACNNIMTLYDIKYDKLDKEEKELLVYDNIPFEESY